jgi:catechol 2,3-dioxygenase-like lactoylglutathione lyase family enzyme
MTATIDHVSLVTTDYDKARAFYDAALGTLGIKPLMEFGEAPERAVGYGSEHPSFWVNETRDNPGHSHIGFVASSRAEVDAFHAAALANGGRDNGGPGLRAEYSPTYYAAFALDPDGHNIEAVCHAPQ